MDYGGTSASMTVPLIVGGSLLINGNLSEGNASVSGGDIQVKGNWTLNTGGAFYANSHMVTFNGGSGQNIAGSLSTAFYNLTISDASNVTLSNISESVTNTLNFGAGLLVLGAYNLTATTSITGYSGTSYVATNNTGSLIVNGISTTPVVVPIGYGTTVTTSYAPITITGSSSANYTCSVSTTIPGSPVTPTQLVNMAWSVVSSSAQTASITYQWDASNDATGFTPTAVCDLGIYGGSSYTVSTPWTPLGTSPTYTLAATGLSVPASGTNKYVIGNSGCFVCSAVNVPYTEGFEGLTSAYTLPSCMAASPTVASGGKTQTRITSATGTNSALTARTGSKYATVYWSPSASTGYFFSRQLNLTYGHTYQASVYYLTDGVAWSTVGLYYGTAATSGAMTNTIATVTNGAATSYTQVAGTFSPPSTGTYYVAFAAYNSTTAPNYCSFDDFSVTDVTPISYTWTGGTNSDWNTTTNWSPTGVPTATDNATIPTTTNPCVVGTGTYAVNNLTTSGTGNFQMASGATLTINGTPTFGSSTTPTFDCASTVNMASTSTITVPAANYGSLNLTGGNRILASSGTIGICKTYTPGSGTFTNTGSTINYNGTGTQTITLFNYNNLTITGPRNASGNAVTLPSGTIDVAGQFTAPASIAAAGVVIASPSGSIMNFSSLSSQNLPAFYYGSITNYTLGSTTTNTGGARVWASSGVIDINYTFAPSTGTNTITGSTIRYSSSSTGFTMSHITTNVSGKDYNNLSFSGSGSWKQGTGINISIVGDDSITGSGTYYVSNNSSANTLTIGGQLVVTNGYFGVTNGSGAASTTVTGNLNLAGGVIYGTTTNATGAGTITVSGNVTVSSGTLFLSMGTSAATAPATMAVNGTSSVFTQSGGTIILAETYSSAYLNLSGASSSFNISGGTFEMNDAYGGYGATSTITLAGAMNLSGGTLDMNTWSSSNVPGKIIVAGALTLSGTAVITCSDPNTSPLDGDITFTGGTSLLPQNIAVSSYTGTIGNAAFYVASGAYVSLQNSLNIAGSTTNIDSFVVNSNGTLVFGTNNVNDGNSSLATFVNNGTLIIGDPNGITSGTTLSGNVQVTNTRGYGATSTCYYTYGGSSSQFTGNGLPSPLAGTLTINNSSGVKLSQSTTVNGTLSMSSGNFDLNGTHNITLGASATFSGENCSSLLVNSGTPTATNGWIGTTRTLAANPGNVANLGLNIATSTAMNSTVIKRFPGKAVITANFNAVNPSISRIYSITPTTAVTGTGFAATLSYCTSEDNGNTESSPNMVVYKSTGTNETASGYGFVGAASFDATAKTVTSIGTNVTAATNYFTLGNADQYCTVANGDWNTGSTWIGGVVPPAGANICIGHNVTVNAANTANTGNVNINTSGTLTISSSYTVNIGAGKTLSNNTGSVASLGSGTVNFVGAGTIAGSKAITFGNLTINTGVLTVPTSNIPIISGTFTLNGGNVNNPPIYGAASTLNYGATYTRYLEWSASGTVGTTPGYPNNVTVSGGTLTIYNSGSLTTPVCNALFQINSGATADFTGSVANLSAAAMTINSGGTVNMSSTANSINVSGDVTNNGTFTMSSAYGGDIYVGGNWIKGASATFTPNNRAVYFNGAATHTVSVTGGGTETFNFLFISGTGTLKLSSSPATNVTVSTASGLTLSSTNATTIDLNGQTMTLSGGGNLILGTGARTITSSAGTAGKFKSTSAVTTVNGAGPITFAANTILDLQNGFDFGASGVTTIAGTLQIDALGYGIEPPTYASGSTLNYNTGSSYTPPLNGEWNENIYAQPGVPYNVILTNGTTLDFALRGFPHEMWGDLTINSGTTLSLNSATSGADLNVKGNWNNSGTFNCNSRMVQCNGSAAQVLTGATTFDYFKINNSAGLTLNNDITVSSVLFLTSGLINTGTNKVNVSSTSAGALSGYTSSSYVNGNLWRYVTGGTSYDFPLGTATSYQLATLNLNSQTGMSYIKGSFTAGLPATGPSGSTCKINGTPITSMLNAGYWTLTPDAYTAANYDITLNQAGYSNSVPGANYLGVIKRHDASSAWLGTDVAGTNGYHSNANSSITSGVATAKRTSITSFSDFGIGVSSTNALPVQLLYFTAEKKNNDGYLTWATASEINNDHFDIERSVDGINFQKVGTVAGHGNSSQTISYDYTDANIVTLNVSVVYYRLKQVDVDGVFTYSDIASVDLGAGANVFHITSVYPNPFTDHVNISFYTPAQRTIKVELYNVAGALVSEESVDAAEGFNVYTASQLSHLASGFYTLNISSGLENYSYKIIKGE